MTTSTDTTPTEQAFAILQNARALHEKHLATLEKDRHKYAPAHFTELATSFSTTEAAQAINTAVAAAQNRRTEAEAKVQKVYQDLSPNGDAAAESRATRYWHHTERLLDNRDNKLSEAQALAKAASREELGTLLQELPAYLNAHNLDAEWLDPYIAQVVPEYGKAKAEFKKADAASLFITHAAAMLQRGIKDGRPIERGHFEKLNPATAGTRTGHFDGHKYQVRTGQYDPDR